jgi:hypothetical protein
MFGWLKALFGRSPVRDESPQDDAANEAFHDDKQRSLDAALGTMDEHVIHAIIPFALGGALDLYPFSKHIPGTVYGTQELLTLDPDDRPKKSRDGWFELAMAFRPAEKASDDEMPESFGLASAILNPAAHYASMASLSPGETAEIPGEDGEPNACVVFDRLDCKPLSAGGTPFFLLLIIQIHPQALAFVREHGAEKLYERLKQKGYYPYSDLDRPSVA